MPTSAAGALDLAISRKEEAMTMSNVRIAVLGIAAMFWSLPTLGQTTPSQTEWINALRAGGHVIVLRHGATHTDQAVIPIQRPPRTCSTATTRFGQSRAFASPCKLLGRDRNYFFCDFIL
jgi:hypothetical protein